MHRHTFTRAEKLLKTEDFSRVFKEGKRRHTKNFSVTIRENGLEVKRLGVSVSSEVGGAVKRNRYKRLIREFFRLNKKEILPGPPVDMVVTVKKGAELINYQKTEEELRAALAAFRFQRP